MGVGNNIYTIGGSDEDGVGMRYGPAEGDSVAETIGMCNRQLSRGLPLVSNGLRGRGWLDNGRKCR
jgi:hypothetical protein